MPRQREYTISILGRTLEHLGVQMYKNRDAAIAELVANSWDAGATEVRITVPIAESYNRESSEIVIRDTGRGMAEQEVQDRYLVVGRNQREEGFNEVDGRKIMGRKGIGKLAGFGIASCMQILTWKDGGAVNFKMDIDELKTTAGDVKDASILADIEDPPDYSKTGTIIRLTNLKQKTPLDIDLLHQSLARRFGRVVKGEMQIYINDEPLREPSIPFVKRFPETGFTEEELPDGSKVQFWYGITDMVIKHSLMQGFSVMVRGKIAQLPPFYFRVENTASHQHGTKYFMGEIIADFIDEGTDDESDLISTDRQEIEWENESLQPLLEWGKQLTRRVLQERYELHSDDLEQSLMQDPEISKRIEALDPQSQTNVSKMVRLIGDTETDKAESIQLVDQLVRAYEFRQFHHVVEDIEKAASEDPVKLVELLRYLSAWRVLESRALLEIIEGRIKISDKLQSFIVNNVPETASASSDDNLHDLVARMPWILDPDWELYGEEKTISKQLYEWDQEEIKATLKAEEARMRYDFLALEGRGEILIIELKRSGHPLQLEELHRLEKYRTLIQRAHKVPVRAVMICSAYEIDEATMENWRGRNDFVIATWAEIHEKTKLFYNHYRSILEGDASDPEFAKKAKEILQLRKIEETGTVKRSSAERKADRKTLFAKGMPAPAKAVLAKPVTLPKPKRNDVSD